MTTAISKQVDSLIKRLNEAEKRAKVLNNEVEGIKQEISLLKQSVSCLPSAKTSPPFTTQARSIFTKSSTDSADGLEIKRNRPSFHEEDGYVVVYTDGACTNNGKASAKAGVGVWFGDNHPLNACKPVVGRATNNTAEIQACVHALNILESQGKDKVKIITDSEFTINCMTKWMRNWKRNNWKTSSGSEVKNKEDLKKLDEMLGKFSDVKWIHIAGHSGHKGNEEADKLARKGAMAY